MPSFQPRGVAGLWLALDGAETAAPALLAGILDPFSKPIQDCFEAGVEAPTLPSAGPASPKTNAAALFLKRVLTDLRGTWLLLRLGYTSPAAAVAASMCENALAVQCILGDDGAFAELQSDTSGDLPWGPQQMAQRIARREHARDSSVPYETRWRELYSAYKWLCKIKHPTTPSALHDSGATALSDGTYVVLGSPDTRSSDAGMKALVLTVVISRASQAIEAFAAARSPDVGSPEYRDFDTRLARGANGARVAFNEQKNPILPVHISDTKLAREWRSLKGL